jgi:hypothetical protein
VGVGIDSTVGAWVNVLLLIRFISCCIASIDRLKNLCSLTVIGLQIRNFVLREKIHYCMYKGHSPYLESEEPSRYLPTNVFKIGFNDILPSAPRS